MRRVLFLLMLLLGALPASAQITVPNTFVAGTTASASQVNANFSALGSSALNRAGGTITGNITVNSGFTIDGVDISAVIGGGQLATGVGTFTSTSGPQLNVLYDIGNKFTLTVSSAGAVTLDASGSGATFTFSDAVTIPNLTIGSTFTCGDCIGAPQIASTAVTAGTYGTSASVPVFIVDADGRLTSASNSAIQIPETAVTDGSLLARVSENTTIIGAWSFTQTLVVSNVAPVVRFDQTDAALDEKYWAEVADSTRFDVRAYNDSLTSYAAPLSIFRSGTTITAISLIATNTNITGNLLVSGAITAENLSVLTSLTVNSSVTFSSTLSVGTTITASTYRFQADFSSGVQYSSGSDTTTLTNGSGETLALNGALNTACLTANTGEICATGGSFRPSDDAGVNLGGTVNRWLTVYALTGTINTSDARLKKDVRPINLGLAFVDALRPVEYKWKDNRVPGKFYGFIAQDLQLLGFEGVDSSNPEALGLRYTELIAPLVRSVQELHKEVDELGAVVTVQGNQIEVLNARLEKLEGTRRKAD